MSLPYKQEAPSMAAAVDGAMCVMWLLDFRFTAYASSTKKSGVGSFLFLRNIDGKALWCSGEGFGSDGLASQFGRFQSEAGQFLTAIEGIFSNHSCGSRNGELF